MRHMPVHEHSPHDGGFRRGGGDSCSHLACHVFCRRRMNSKALSKKCFIWYLGEMILSATLLKDQRTYM